MLKKGWDYNMNKYVKEYLLRGLIFSGLGPVVGGCVYLFIELSGEGLALNGYELFLAIITTYIIAFVHAGSSVFPTIERWSKVKAMFVQLLSLYSVYTIGYLINFWIPFKIEIIAIYTSCFIGGFLLIWLFAVISSRIASNKLNAKLMNIKNQQK